jgi:hypothetical protein
MYYMPDARFEDCSRGRDNSNACELIVTVVGSFDDKGTFSVEGSMGGRMSHVFIC